MAIKAKLLKPGMVVFDLDHSLYVILKGESANFPGKGFVIHPNLNENLAYLARIRMLNRKELGLP
jgi:hypothetical protein